MPTDVRPDATLAVAHECTRCRSCEVTVVMHLDEVVATARCRACGAEGPLVPAGFAC